MNSLITYLHFFQAGGFFMYPILLILAVGTAIVLERTIVIAWSRVNGEKLWNQISPALLSRRMDDAIRTCTRSHAPLYQVLTAGIRSMKGTFSREDVQGTIDEALIQVVPRLEARLHYLPNLANVATLLGLLGTIIGLIQAFTAVSLADPSQKAALLAKGISVAMNTTAFGLIVAVPLVMIYSFLQNRTNRIIDHLEEYSLRLVNLASQISREEAFTERPSARGNGGSEGRRDSSDVSSMKGAGHAR
jgi:biopolymer transport protein ExbB/TolQ